MICPNCSKNNSDSAGFCGYCGTPLTGVAQKRTAPRLKGTLSSGATVHPPGKNSALDGANKASCDYKGMPSMTSGRFRGSLGNAQNKASEPAHPASNAHASFGKIKGIRDPECDDRDVQTYRFCKKCGRRLNNGEERCPSCDPVGTISTEGESKAAKPWIIAVSIAAAFLLVVGISSAVTHKGETIKLPSTSAQSSQQMISPSSTPRVTAQPDVSSPTPKPVQSTTPTATPKSGPGPNDMKGHDSRIVQPASTAWLTDYEVRYVQSNGGVSIYLRYGPSKDYEHFDTVKDGEATTVLAEQDGFALVIASGDRMGWCNSSLIVSNGEKIAPVPSFNETYWTYTEGQSLGFVHACLFHSNGTYSAFSWGGATYSEGTYSLEGRRLNLDSAKFVWDGEQFVSTEKYEMQEGSDYLYLTPDPTAYYEEIRSTVEGWSQTAESDTTDDTLSDGSYFVELVYEEYWGDHDFITVDLLRVTGVAPSDNLIFDKTGKSYFLMISNSCTIRDSSVFDENGLTEKYYSDIGPIIDEYGFGITLKIEIDNGEIVFIDKFYIA